MQRRLVLVALTALATASGLVAVALFAQGSLPSGLAAVAVAMGGALFTWRGLVARARMRRERVAARERAFLEAMRRPPRR